MDLLEKFVASAKDKQVQRIRHSLDTRIHEFVEFQRYHLNRYAEIGMSLSGEENTARLLEMIVFEAREITNADAGSLYLINEEATHLDFVILQNDSMNTLLGGVSGERIVLPPVPLRVKDEENHANVSSHVALTGEIINIPDVYRSQEFDFSGARRYDESSGYRSKSMLVIPMRNHENAVIGVLQLLNALDHDTRKVVDFQDEQVGLIASLASQAAVTLTKTRLIRDLKQLLDAFIQSIAVAIEEKSRYTGGHIARVSKLSTLLAKKVNEDESGAFKDTRFSDQEIEELRLAGWLHDIGKIVTPEYVVDKSAKLETIFDRIGLIETRFDFIAKSLEAEGLRRQLDLLRQGQGRDALDLERERVQADLAELEEERAFLRRANTPSEYMNEQALERLRRIAGKTYEREGRTLPYLSEDELKNLSIRRGTLTEEERGIIRNHAVVTHKMLSALPFPRHLARVPEFASHHHEKMDGSGYPFGLKGEQLSLQARIMAVADIFEALTAPDRPYKQPMSLSLAVKILGDLKKQGHIDPDVHDLLVSSGALPIYAAEELNPDQVDIPLELGRAARKEESPKRRLAQLLDAPAPLPTRDSALRVLVVDDSVSMRMLLSYYLKGASCRVFETGGALEAVKLYTSGGIDLMLMDLALPDIDGYAAVAGLRAWERRLGLDPRPILAMSAHFYLDEPERRDKAGFTGKLDRPLTRKKLLEAIEAALGG
jgi:HD-GYP domain-containing protein (c-di-GMP phosphodiesterase class II)